MRTGVITSILVATTVIGCSHTTAVQPTPLPEASAYKSTANPAEQLPLLHDQWWTLYQDPELDRLQQQLLLNSPNLASALARYQQAHALTDSLRAARLPTVGATVDSARNLQSEHRPLRGATSPDYYNSGTVGLSFDYEVDLWGRVSQQVAAGVAEEQAAQADLAGARLSLQTELADTLLALRGTDQEIGLLRELEGSFVRTLGMVGERHRAGLASGFDLAQAESQLESIRSQLHQVQAQRDILEHAVAALVGAHASTFEIAAVAANDVLPTIPSGLPSELLQRRPDIAAAQRRVTAANARVGVARTAFFPSLRLSAMGGYQSSDLSNLILAPNLFWAIGAGVLTNVFDGGRRHAEVARTEAVLDEAGQNYRSTVLAAFRQVEDQLIQLRRFGEAADAEQRTVAASQRALEMATTRYREGASSYLAVVSAQTSNLQARRNALSLTTRQRRTSVQLVKALGGGWSSEMETP